MRKACMIMLARYTVNGSPSRRAKQHASEPESAALDVRRTKVRFPSLSSFGLNKQTIFHFGTGDSSDWRMCDSSRLMRFSG